MNKSWPIIKPVIKNGKPAVLVDARIAGKGQRLFFSSEKTAEAWAQVQRARRKSEGDSAFRFRATDRIDAEAALKLIAPYKISLRECADFYGRHAATATGDKTIRQIVDELLSVKKAAGMSARYLKDPRIRLNIFAHRLAMSAP